MSAMTFFGRMVSTAVACTVACVAHAANPSAICSLDIIFDSDFDIAATVDLTSPGPYTVATVSGSSVRGSRTTPWSASYPVGGGAAPVIAFVPGFQLPSSLYQGWVAHLASWGYIAVRTDPPSSFFSIDEPAMALDVSNVITDILKPAALPIGADSSHIAVSGHGSGGKVAYLIAANDARIKGVFTFDPFNEAGSSGYTSQQPSIVPQPVGSIGVPTGILGELLDATSSGGMACNPASTNYQTIFSAESMAPVAYEWTLSGASYTSFVPDQAGCGSSCSFCQTATLPAADTYAFMRSSAVAFLRTHLEGTPRLCSWLVGDGVPNFVGVRESTKP